LAERDGKVSTRRMLPLCLSYDSTVIKEGTAAQFMAVLATLLADLRRVTL
jgi:pyruvate/2-oxoglutarate dehydrogenase complex dihydrolipoamide acyltransferase (E2) component